MRRTIPMLALLAVAALLEATAHARKAKPKDKFYIQLVAGETANGVPAELMGRAKEVAQEALRGRKEFVTTLTGAPDPAANPEAFKAFLKKKKLKALSVVAKVTA